MIITKEYIESQPFEIVGNGREIRLNCPNCDDTTKHLYVNMDRTLWYCFKCGKGGKVKRGVLSAPSLEEFASKFSSGRSYCNPGEVEIEEKNRIKSLPANFWLKNVLSKSSLESLKYLKSRGITESEIIKYDIRGSIEGSGPYKNCIIFPVFNEKGELAYFVARKYDNSKPKYVNAPWSKDDTLFIAYGKDSNINVIVEGIFDALAIARVGFNGIALLGKTATSHQLDRLVQIHSKSYCIIYLDNDALTHAVSLKLQLSGLGIKSELVRQDKDAADLYLEHPKALYEAISYGVKFTARP